MSADQYIGLSITRHFVLLVSTPLSPSQTTSSSSFLHFPSPLHSPSLSSVYPLWRGPVMSAPSSDKPSPSLPLFCRTRGSRKGGLAAQQTGASQAGRSGAQRGSGVDVSLEPGWGVRGCSLPRIERQWRGHFYRAWSQSDVECTLTHTLSHTCIRSALTKLKNKSVMK